MSDARGQAPATGLVAGLDPQPMLWLALPPYWTGEAALAAGFPAPRLDRPPGRHTAEDLVAFVTASAQQGRAERRGVLTADAMWTAEFWCPPARRRLELEAAVDRSGRQAVVSEARRIATLLTRLDLDLPLAPVVQHWARLMLADDADRPDQSFLNTVRKLCRANRRDEALEHIVAAEALAPIASEAMQEAIEAAHRLVHLANRRSHDRKTLESYQPRTEWSARLRRLLTSEGSEHWAMHLIGLGGTGKTSFVRYIASGGFAADCALAELTVARVDFDHLSPAYPAQRPVHLLVELADELAQDAATAEGERALAAFYHWARRANAAAARSDDTAEPVSRAVEAFAGLLRTVPGPTLLMLDTCEELSKFDPAGTTDAALETTFDLLARVHAAVPTLRVLLSGRRPLSPTGPAWRRLETMPALGFRRDEAIAFLGRGHLGAVMPADLAEAVLALSPELGRPRPGEARFSPYDLALYWRWWAAEKNITASDLRRSGKAAYVEARIVNRLHGSLTAWLPGVALLGRFDHRMLAPALPERADAAEVVHELAQQEWIDTDTDPASRALILEVDAPLRDLLLEWARTCEPGLLESSRRALAEALADRTGSLPLEQISTAHVLSALRLATVDEAVLLWERLEARMSDAHDWAWMAQVCPRILGAAREGPDAGTGPDVQEGVAGNSLLVAAVRATAIALGLRRGADLDPAAAWQEVEASVGARGGAIARRLRIRARLGRAGATIGSGRALESAAAVEHLARLIHDAREFPGRLDGSVVAAVEAIADHRAPGADPAPIVAAAERWSAATGDPLVRTLLHVARIRLLGRPVADAVIDIAPAGTGGGRWADWRAPSHPATRVHLYAAWEAYAQARPLPSLPLRRWERAAEDDLRSIDGERLLSQCLQLRLGYGTVRRERLDGLRLLDVHDAGRRGTRRIHDQVPSLFVSISEGYLMLGDPDSAQRVLTQRLRDAGSDRRAEQIRHAGQAALLRLARRMRDRRPVALIGPVDAPGPRWAADALIDGVAPPDGHDPALRRWHERWQSSFADVTTGLVEVPAPPPSGAAPDGELAESLRADAAEAERVGTGPGLAAVRRLADALEPGPAPGRLEQDWPLTRVRTALAAATTLDDLHRRLPPVPPMYLALTGLELGELRAMRDPGGALALLALAAERSGPRSPVIALQAITLLALAVVHRGDDTTRPAPKQIVLDLNAAYERLREHAGDDALPPWEELIDSPAVLTGPWHGWLERIRVAVAGLAWLAGDGGAPPAAPADGPVELYPGRFGPPPPQAPAAGPPPEQRAGLPATLRVTDRAQLAILAAAVRPAGTSRVSVTVRARPRQIEVSVDRLPAAWQPEPPGVLERGVRRMLGGRPHGVVAMAPGDLVPALPDLVRDVLHVRGPRKLVGRLLVPPGDQVRFWEAEITARLGGGTEVSGPRWFREWRHRAPVGAPPGWRSGRPASGCGDDPAAVVHLIGQPAAPGLPGFQVDAPQAADPVIVTPSGLARRGAALVVVQGRAHPDFSTTDPVRDIEALRFGVRCMDAGVRALLLVPSLPATAEPSIAGHLAALAARAAAPSHPDLVALAADVRQALGRDPGHVVLFLSEGENR